MACAHMLCLFEDDEHAFNSPCDRLCCGTTANDTAIDTASCCCSQLMVMQAIMSCESAN